MYDYVFNEEEKKRKRRWEEKKALPFFVIAKWEQDVDSRIRLLHFGYQ